MKNLFDIQIWKQQLGLLPIHLNPLSEKEGYMMLNGGNGDFCLQTTNIKAEKLIFILNLGQVAQKTI